MAACPAQLQGLLAGSAFILEIARLYPTMIGSVAESPEAARLLAGATA